jgi:hypothetical protein
MGAEKFFGILCKPLHRFTVCAADRFFQVALVNQAAELRIQTLALIEQHRSAGGRLRRYRLAVRRV